MSFTTHDSNTDILKLLLDKTPPPFALLHRPDTSGMENVDIVTGDISIVDSLDEIELPDEQQGHGEAIHDKLILLPYRQIAQRGFEATDDGTPLVVMDISRQEVRKVKDVVAGIPDCQLELENAGFDIDDVDYEAIVKNILVEEIGQGKGASFVIKRTFTADITNYSVPGALHIFKKLLTRENGAYWTFIVHTGERTLIGSTPERHVSLNDGIATMNPISGTYRYPPSGPKLPEITAFLRDRKEVDELYIVVDEELKMMNQVCDKGAWLGGPEFKEMACLAHTEYFIHGRSSMTPLEILGKTMFAPTVMGGPLESAARVIHEYEPGGRGYYSGVIALISRNNHKRELDSGILIRTADISNEGRLQIAVGATLVRSSEPSAEMEETRTKASALLSAFGIQSKTGFGKHPDVVRLLEQRNDSISKFWLKSPPAEPSSESILSEKKVLIIDAEDTFTSMIAHQLGSLGCKPQVRRFDEPYSFDDDYDLVVMGPGPGDPRDLDDPKIARLNQAIKELLSRRLPFLCVCLSHQVLVSVLGLKLVRRKDPNQGVQKEIDLFGKRQRVGFYNTFSARCDHDHIALPMELGMAQLSRDSLSGEVHAIRGDSFCGIQFHAESLLTIDGVGIFQEILNRLCQNDTGPRRSSGLTHLPADSSFNRDPGFPISRNTGSRIDATAEFGTFIASGNTFKI